jgi:hypothetical protein
VVDLLAGEPARLERGDYGRMAFMDIEIKRCFL